MPKDGSTTRGLPNNISTTAKTELMEVPRDSSLHNNDKNSKHKNKARTTVIDKTNEMLEANTASHNVNIDENGTAAAKHAQQLPGNKPQQNSTTTTLNNTELARCENSTQAITTASQSNYTPRRKHGVIFQAVDGFSIE
jgi:hypothetical protein